MSGNGFERVKRAKDEAVNLYHAWLRAQGFQRRPQQLEMIEAMVEAMARTEHLKILVEAGTGTGKTIAYLVAGLSLLRNRHDGAHLIVVTSTVALQGQLLHGELPQLAELTQLTYAVAKGRERWVCTHRLNQQTKDLNRTLDLGDRRPSLAEKSELAMQLLESGKWNGDLDDSPVKFERNERGDITTNAQGCRQRECTFFHSCPYFGARRAWKEAEVVVTNYDLLLLDREGELGILPPPGDSVYVFDEAQHLTSKVTRVFQMSANIGSMAENIQRWRPLMESYTRAFSSDGKPSFGFAAATKVLNALLEVLVMTNAQLVQESFEGEPPTVYFRRGIVPLRVRERLSPLRPHLVTVTNLFESVSVQIDDALNDVGKLDSQWANDNREAIQEGLENCVAVRATLDDWCASDESTTHARWLSQTNSKESDGVELHSVPIAIDDLLNNTLWRNSRAAACVSATLGSHDDFRTLKENFGLAEEVSSLCLPSPFDAANVHLRVMTSMQYVPDFQNEQAFLNELATKLPTWLNKHRSGLVVLTSLNSLKTLKRKLPPQFLDQCLFQSDYPSGESLLSAHSAKIESGERSYILGLATFREGIDLPGELCEQVVVAKLPFPVMEDPVLKARKERQFPDQTNRFVGWREFDLYEGTLLLAQTCGRLIRNESDKGTITIADKRIWTKNYRNYMLRVLPYEVHLE